MCIRDSFRADYLCRRTFIKDVGPSSQNNCHWKNRLVIMENSELKRLEKSSRQSGFLSLAGILIFIGSLIFASVSLNQTTNKLEESEKEIADLIFKIDSLNLYY